MTAPAQMLWTKRVTTTEERAVARTFVNEHHSYIQWADRPSRKLYWNLYEGDRQVGVFGLGSAFAFPKPVKEFMAEHRLGFNEVANNTVYALFGQEDRNAGSRLLSLVRRDAVLWWRERYGDALRAFQTFVLPPRSGAIYRADNWTVIGMTKGKSQSVRTLYGDDRNNPKAERRVMSGGQVKYLLREHSDAEPKIIFMRLQK